MSYIEVNIALSSIGILHLHDDFYTQIQNNYCQMIDEINNLHIDWTIENVKFPMNFGVIEKPDSVKEMFPNSQLCKHICSITSNIDLSNYFAEHCNSYKQAFEDDIRLRDYYKNTDWTEQVKHDLADVIEKRVYDFMLAVNIVYPGFFAISECVILIDQVHKLKISTVYNNLLNAYHEILEKKWPELGVISIKQAWIWLETKTKCLDEVGDKPIDRAINGLSYAFNSNNYEDLFYTLLGLEALYNTEQSDGIMEQIKVKTAYLFGEPTCYKKRVSKMYAIRSAFIHGKLNFPNKFHIYDAQNQYANFLLHDYFETVSFAQSLLIATIRELIKRNASELVSKTIVELQ